nr:reverse transcriptase domain-containing protein [Tanacetum cinerariifolium]
MADRTIEEPLQAPTEGYGDDIAILKILAENFEIKTNLLQLVQTNKFHCFERDNPHTHISNFKRMTSTLKYRDVPNDAIKLMLLSYSLEGAAIIWYEKEPPNSILTWDDLINVFMNQFFPPSKTTHLKNEISRFTQRFEETFGEAWERFKKMLRACPHHGFSELTQIDTFYNSLNEQDQDSLNDAVGGNLLIEIVNKQVITPATVKAVEKSCVICGGAHDYYDCIATDSNQSSVCAATASTLGTLSSNTIPNPKGEMKAVTTRSGLGYEGPSIPTNSSPEKVVERETEETTNKEQTNFQGSTAHIQPLVVPIPILKPDVLKTQPKPNIPYPSRLNDQKLCEKATNQMEKFFQIFHDLHFDISFADALLLMLKFASTIKSLLTNKDKLFELGKVLLNENCLAMLLKKLLEKLGDPGKFLIPSDRSITRPKRVAEDVFVKMGKFYFPIDFLVVDFKADPRVPLILGRSFLRTGRALINVYGEEITLRVNDESVTFNLNQTMRYSSTYDDNSMNRVDVIDIACEEYAQDVLDFKYNPRVTILLCDFLLEEIEDFLKDESIQTGIEDSFYDPEGDILYLAKLLNDDPSQVPLMDLKQAEETKAKSLIEEPSKLELKELPSYLEYAFLEETDKLPIIIAKDLKDDEKKLS